MRLIFGVLRDRPAESGASNPPTFTPHSLSHPLFGVLYLWRHRLGDIVWATSFHRTRLPVTRNGFIFGLNYFH